ncbi:MAG: ABC transporter permease [Meiothermus sp.]|nr:ABC transporter permease [Meiothermus sp.]
MQLDEVTAAFLRMLIFSTPILLAALGEIIAERSGVVNLGVEGMMAVGALAAFAVTNGTGNPVLGVVAGVLAGGLAALLHAFVSVTLRANQFVSGLALAMFGIGLAGLLGKRYEGQPVAVQIPELVFTPIAILLALAVWFVFYVTRAGLTLRSVGENPAAADALGIDVARVRYLAVAIGGMFAGMAGAFLAVSYRSSWTEGMTNQLGWIAVALTIFVSWQPIRAIFGSFFFGLLYYLSFALQNTPIPSVFLQALPYALVIVVLTLVSLRRGQGSAPEALGLPYQRGQR